MTTITIDPGKFKGDYRVVQPSTGYKSEWYDVAHIPNGVNVISRLW
jgi:hypothetical protein